MKRERDQILDRVREQVPPPPDAFERLWRRRESKAMRSRIFAGGLGLAVTLAIVVGILASGALRSSPVPAPPAQGSPSVALVAGDGQYYYVRATQFGLRVDGTTGKIAETQVWFGPDDSGRIRSHGSSGTQDQTYGAGQFPGEILGLSTEPDRLLQQLIDRGATDGASPNAIATTSPGRSQETTALLRTVDDLLNHSSDALLTPEQTRALYTALQGIPDITVEPGVLDPVGRPAVRMSFVIDYGDAASVSRPQWYFSPDLGQFLGSYDLVIEEAGIAESVDSPPPADALYVEPGSVDSVIPTVVPTPQPASK